MCDNKQDFNTSNHLYFFFLNQEIKFKIWLSITCINVRNNACLVSTEKQMRLSDRELKVCQWTSFENIKLKNNRWIVRNSLYVDIMKFLYRITYKVS